MAHIAFLTLFLGLVAGRQTVTLEVDQVRTVRIDVDSHALSTLRGAPWSAVIDLGPELTPRRLEAIGYDASGNEVARVTQILNLPRPTAELEIVIEQDGERAAVAHLVGRHRTHALPKRATLSMDGKTIELSRDLSGRLPKLIGSHPHILSAELRFEDGEVARRELVMAAGLGESVGSELTPVLLVANGRHTPASFRGCFSLGGRELRVNAVEKGRALVIMVKDPDPHEVLRQLRRSRPGIDLVSRSSSIEGHDARLSTNTAEEAIWPVVQRFPSADEPTSVLFEHSEEVDAHDFRMLWLLTRSLDGSPNVLGPRRFADAVAVAGVTSLHGRRRAVVLLLGTLRDESTYTPAVVRRYLEDIGVPLFVWSAAGPRPDLADSWGLVDDISTEKGLRLATAKLDAAIANQRIAWVATDPLGALSVEVKDPCGLRPVALPPHQVEASKD
jgi:hypothetical protein